jgi:hypothetical protein
MGMAVDLPGWLPPAITSLGGVALGAWLVDRFTGNRWLRQQQWASREQHYLNLLTHLNKARMDLERQGTYYDVPGSEHNDYSGNEHFIALGNAISESLNAVRELSGPARVFLAKPAIDALEKLDREERQAEEHSMFQGEYIDTTLPLVREAENVVLAAAQLQLNPKL